MAVASVSNLHGCRVWPDSIHHRCYTMEVRGLRLESLRNETVCEANSVDALTVELYGLSLGLILVWFDMRMFAQLTACVVTRERKRMGSKCTNDLNLKSNDHTRSAGTTPKKKRSCPGSHRDLQHS